MKLSYFILAMLLAILTVNVQAKEVKWKTKFNKSGSMKIDYRMEKVKSSNGKKHVKLEYKIEHNTRKN